MSTDPPEGPNASLHPDMPPRERALRIARLRRLATGLKVVTGVLVVAGFIWSDANSPALAMALAVLPWVAIWLVARFQPLYRFGGRRNDPHPDLTVTLMVPGLFLLLPVLYTIHTLDWKAPLVLAVGGGVALTGLAARIDPWFRQQRWTVLLVGLFTCSYGYSAGLELNALADPSSPRIYPVRVLARRASHGTRSTSCYLRLGPWGPYTDSREVNVPASRYRLTHPGDLVCVFLGSGALGISWYRIDSCGGTSAGASAAASESPSGAR